MDLLEHLSSITRGSQSLFDVAKATKVLIVGATCAGKSVVGSALRQSALALEKHIDLPRRLITRASRPDDRVDEVECVSSADFIARIASGRLAIHWQRHMEGGRILRYGCVPPEPPSALPIYLGGNGLYENRSSVQPVGVLEGALFVGISAPPDVRERRLMARSPELVRDSPAEAEFRLAFDDAAMTPYVHFVVRNWGAYEGTAPADVVALIERIVSRRAG